MRRFARRDVVMYFAESNRSSRIDMVAEPEFLATSCAPGEKILRSNPAFLARARPQGVRRFSLPRRGGEHRRHRNVDSRLDQKLAKCSLRIDRDRASIGDGESGFFDPFAALLVKAPVTAPLMLPRAERNFTNKARSIYSGRSPNRFSLKTMVPAIAYPSVRRDSAFHSDIHRLDPDERHGHVMPAVLLHAKVELLNEEMPPIGAAGPCHRGFPNPPYVGAVRLRRRPRGGF